MNSSYREATPRAKREVVLAYENRSAAVHDPLAECITLLETMP
jgi:hypothetical protein